MESFHACVALNDAESCYQDLNRDYEARDDNKMSALTLAMFQDQAKQFVKFFGQHAPDIQRMLCSQDIYDRTCLHYAVLLNKFDVVKQILYYCPKPQQLILMPDIGKNNVFHLLAQSSTYNQPLILFLIQFIHKTNMNATNSDNKTPFQVAMSRHSKYAMDLLPFVTFKQYQEAIEARYTCHQGLPQEEST